MQIQNNGICFVSVPNVLKSNNLLDVYNTTLSLASFYNDYGFGIISDIQPSKGILVNQMNSLHHSKINNVVSNLYSNITAPSRFGSSFNLTNLVTDLKDYPVNSMAVTWSKYPLLLFERLDYPLF